MNGTTRRTLWLWIPVLIVFTAALILHGYHFIELTRTLPLETELLRGTSDKYPYPEPDKNTQDAMPWLVHNPYRATQSLFDQYFTFDIKHDNLGIDFFQFYVSGLRLLNGESIYLDEEYISWVPQESYNRYPPLVAGLIGIPSSVWTPWHAYLIWLIIIELLIAFVIVTIVRLLGFNPLSLAVAIPWLLSAPISSELRFGQINVFIAAGTLAAFLLAARNRNTATGAALGIVTGVKLIPILFFPYFWKTTARWHALIALMIAGGVSLAYFIIHPGDFGRFTGWVLNTRGANGVGLQTLLIKQTGSIWIPKIIGGLLALAALRATWKAPRPTGSLLALWISVYFLVYNRVWSHHFSMLFLGIAVSMIDRKRISLLIPLALASLPEAVFSSELLSQILHSAASVWLFTVCLVEVSRNARKPLTVQQSDS